MVAYENFFEFCKNFLSKARLKIFLIDNHHETMYKQKCIPVEYIQTVAVAARGGLHPGTPSLWTGATLDRDLPPPPGQNDRCF